jgi:hypothetical protein
LFADSLPARRLARVVGIRNVACGDARTRIGGGAPGGRSRGGPGHQARLESALWGPSITDLDTLEQALLGFGRRYEQIAQPFEWKFTRQDLDRVLDRVEQAPQPLPSSQAA